MWTNPLKEEEVCPHQKLAVSVISMAIEDAAGNVRARGAHDPDRSEMTASAKGWIETDSEALELWCALAQTSVREVRAHLIYRLDSGSGLRTKASVSWTPARRAAQDEKERIHDSGLSGNGHGGLSEGC